MNLTTPDKPTATAQPQVKQPERSTPRAAQPVIAFVLMVIACQCTVWVYSWRHVGRILSEGTFSVYNLMLAASAVLILIHARRTRDSSLAWRVADLAGCCFIATWVFKLTCPFPRPGGGAHGFPSGHTLTSFAACWLLMSTFPRVSRFTFLIAAAVGWSRVEIREHYIYQVIGGALFGMMVGYYVSRAKAGVGVVLPRLFRRRVKTTNTETLL